MRNNTQSTHAASLSTDSREVVYAVTLANEGVFIAPPMTVERYAGLVGISQSAVYAQIQRGYLPTFKQGRYRLINTYRMAMDCLADAS